MREAPVHRCRVLASPWSGVHATDIESARHYGRHWHSTYGLGLIDAGAHRSSSGHGAVEAFAGDIVSTNPGEVHDGRPLGAPSRRWRTVYLEPEVLASVHAEGGGSGEVAFTAPAFHDPRLRADVLRLLSALAAWTGGQRHPAAALACEEALVAACGRMLREHAQQPRPAAPAPASLAPVVERLSDAGAAAPSLAELAQLAGLGRFQLLRRFRAALGTTPHAWLLQQRAERARGLLAQGWTIGAAAQDAGFADQSHLTRVFVRRFGYTPGAWRRAVAPRTGAQ
jgi:AraC-like DNA-binding protein